MSGGSDPQTDWHQKLEDLRDAAFAEDYAGRSVERER